MKIVPIHQPADFNDVLSRNEFSSFLFKSLIPFGDPIEDIEKCIDYAFSNNEFAGGFLLAAFEEENLCGALIVNNTGMSGYIPEHILVYVAVDSSMRGRGIGKQLIEKAISMCDGNMKLHVEYNNPAKRLYERIGFESKYADMRYQNKK